MKSSTTSTKTSSSSSSLSSSSMSSQKSSRSTTNSTNSIESIGMGVGQQQQHQHQQNQQQQQPQPSVDFHGFDMTQLPKLKEFTIAKLEPESGSPIGEYMYNCIAYIFYCPLHRRIMLSLNERNNAVWLPFVALQPDKTWNMATTEGIAIIFSKEDSEIDPRLVKTIPVQSINCVHILRIQLPMTKKFIYRLIQLVTLDSVNQPPGDTATQFKCCTSSKHLQWIDMNDAITGNISGLWGPEVPMFVSFLVETNKPREISEIGFNVDNLITMIGLQDLINQQQQQQQQQNKNIDQILANTFHISKMDIGKIYSDFLEHCFPSFYMTYWSFCSYINDYFHECDTLLQLFQAFNSNRCGYLTFQEFFSGIVSIEPGCPNTNQRLRFIFRYYDLERRDHLDQNDMARMFRDLNWNEQSLGTWKNFPINFDQFIHLVSNDSIRTESLCRASSPLLVHICHNFQRRNDTRISAYRKSRVESSHHHHSSSVIVDKSHGPCLACRERNYEFGSHCVRFDPIGRCIEARNILEHDDTNELNISNDPTVNNDKNEMTMHKYSQDYVFSTVSIGPTFLDMLREFNAANAVQQQQQQSRKDRHINNKQQHQPLGFFAGTDNNHDLFIRYVTILCQNVRAIFDCEDKLIRINSSSYIIGDIIGDLGNLIKMERALWTSVPVVPSNYVFLGNYVNGIGINSMGIECILYLFALKIITPNKFFLLRGHNECRQMQKNKFQSECNRKYGDKSGHILYELINDIFDRMPLAIIIDESVACVNNNLPIRTTTSIDDINNNLPKELKDPNQFPIVKEILINVSRMNTADDNQNIDYLNRNGLTHLIRANQQLDRGFHIGGQKRIINLFSVPNSSAIIGSSAATNTGGRNDHELTVVVVDSPKIRIIKINTIIE
ncbi:LOW QUALITY PROTEIN: uncharacterized protein LOC124494277 [Dermatophagoides farinae]|uniref:LOW QUALITY PROTEIN: uncharacterized protein LOC124494277 n=1 Tax=Dermatophagoides farinae TaxID=6954 RepID=UPI003F617B11